MSKDYEVVVENGTSLIKVVWVTDIKITTYSNKLGQYHRELGPAFLYETSPDKAALTWFYEGKKHKYGGPAFIDYDGSHDYFVHGQDVTTAVKLWMKERKYVLEDMTDIEKWELEMFMRSL